MTCAGDFGDWLAWAFAGLACGFCIYQIGVRHGVAKLAKALGLNGTSSACEPGDTNG